MGESDESVPADDSVPANERAPADERPHVLTVVGARPQFVKAAAVSRALQGRIDETVVHTGQHYDAELSAVFFDELSLDEPDYRLDVGSDTHAAQTAAVMVEIERLVDAEEPDAVLVYGDTNSTLAGALAAAKREPTLVHVEAGLRSGDRSMPEEINRISTDHCADVHYAPSDHAVATLEREGITDGVVDVGDVMYDTLLQVRDRLTDGDVADALVPAGETPNDGHPADQLTPGDDAFVLATVHRAANTDDPDRLESIVEGLSALARPVVLPAHPRTVDALRREGLWARASDGIDLVEPVGYLDFLRLLVAADCVATDSGGVQKEAFYLDTPCVTLRETTEWVETVEAGWNHLVGADADRIVEAVESAERPATKPDRYGSGTAAARIAADLQRRLDPTT
ncbi:UDP-N-acetylglucosamine 2-epimerase [Halovivax ruber XH-70]|uniref:UDP-N-acetylglucosamine 2-epimerase n=1 Tax=Halovivax ruber (strain DSM 18193 / JCM 13892 / XH-70) TaxID=797302 RepID=L0I959_HALRX|nr:UDP-N-acetylglucosamine 2-epimerase (non-hydrolyzing) [Halovivax ruber]AGB15244.1 UDP-N-acetylglucosamine 2-epimerase [Halovivax ruber XH-70]